MGDKYFHSEELDLDGKIDLDTGVVTIKDRVPAIFHKAAWVEYSPEEMEIVRESSGKISKDIHMIKKIFGGEIVRDKNNPEKEREYYGTGNIKKTPESSSKNGSPGAGENRQAAAGKERGVHSGNDRNNEKGAVSPSPSNGFFDFDRES